MPGKLKGGPNSPSQMFEEIFVEKNVYSNKSVIRFKSSVLFDCFIQKAQADFNLSDLMVNATVMRFHTTKDKLRCHIIINTVSMSVEISDKGHKLWVHEFFTIGFQTILQQLVLKTNSVKQQEPTTVTNLAADLVELKEQVKTMRQESYASVCSLSVNKPTGMNQTGPVNKNKTTPRVQTSKKSTTQSGSNSQKGNINNTPTSRLSTSARSTTVHASTDKTPPSSPSTERAIPTVTKNTLLIGSSVLSRVNPKGLNNRVHKQAVPGATIKTLLSDIKLFNMSIFSSVVIYIGGNDVANGDEPELIEERYDQLLKYLKTANPSLSIYVSKIAPRGDADVSVINFVVDRLAEHHDAKIIDIFQAFHDSKGDVCMRYICKDSIHPSSSGVKRILGTIDKQINLVSNYDNCVYMRNTVRSRSHEMFSSCFKCGEINHTTKQCRHNTPVVCWGCGFSGHKQQHCWKYV